MSRTHVLSVHVLRRTARARERILQQSFDHVRRTGDPQEKQALAEHGVPGWGRGARVEKAGRFQWAVVVTESRSA